jgi:hypothetical protein
VKRVLGRYGLDLLKPEKAYEEGYMLLDRESGRIVFGDSPARFSKSLDDIEAYVENLASQG